MIGSGVYLLPAAAAALLGAVSLWAVILAGCAVALLVLCFAEAASYFDEPGGGYLYTREAFGDFVGFEVGWMTWLARVASVASLSVGFALATSYLWPAAAGGWERAAVITLPLIFLTWVNIVGVKPGARVAVVLTIAKLLPLVFLIRPCARPLRLIRRPGHAFHHRAAGNLRGDGCRPPDPSQALFGQTGSDPASGRLRDSRSRARPLPGVPGECDAGEPRRRRGGATHGCRHLPGPAEQTSSAGHRSVLIPGLRYA